jgi:hypothetical protein
MEIKIWLTPNLLTRQIRKTSTVTIARIGIGIMDRMVAIKVSANALVLIASISGNSEIIGIAVNSSRGSEKN